MNDHYEITAIKNRNQRRLLTTKILGALSMLFVYMIIATIVGALVTFISPIAGIITWFSILIGWFVIKWHANTIQYHSAIDNFLELYHAERLLPSHRYQQLFDVLDGICVGMNIQRPDVYLIDFEQFITFNPTKIVYEHPEEKEIYNIKPFVSKLIQKNILGLQLDGRTILVMNQAILDELTRYEIEALIAIEIGYTKNLFNTFLLLHHIVYDTINKFTNVIIALTITYTIFLFKFNRNSHMNHLEWQILIAVGITFAVFYTGKLISYQIFRHHNWQMIEKLDQNAIALTNNPQILISALTKLKQNNYNPIGDSMYNNLWLNPLTDDTGDYQNLKTLDMIYKMIVNDNFLAKNTLVNQALRISIDDQLKFLYTKYQIPEPDDFKRDHKQQPQSPVAQQNAYENEFNAQNVNMHYVD